MKKSFFILLALSLIGITACGQTATNTTSTTNSAQAQSSSKAVTITDFANRNVAFTAAPQKIVALSNGEMDIVYALGGTLVGRPTAAGPVSIPEAKNVEQVGSTHGMDLEKVAFLSPDVVLGNNPLNTKDIPAVEGIGAKMVLTNANSIEEVMKQIQLFGQMLQKEDKAKQLNQAIEQKLKELKTNQSAVKPRVLMVYGAPGTYMAALNNSLSGSLLISAGGENIAADYPKLDNYPQYAQLNTEKIMKSNPQLILIMSHGNPEKVKDGFLKEMQQNAAWSSMDAVKNNKVEILPADLFGTNPGTKVIEALDMMNKLLQGVK
ncbi:ABC transporter substrate-binding protein [Paenibacillus radicis (ex Xue et al. 2023)]|uniref:ABC transporter substrate-binding protein n=1 Tax=Paenibacillus radicis (ex Xue et al. 2023) TaxID=2972489 RepID=A0ABT1YTK7_9BACL|nr:ABC transporter substrate-binding protein [Paenibacillus radicis (ex Xue et al. 2023)]MCR8635638.1 ABC transporter substrate-binding protein [Paenibacillus radicis (ex Xue et al. 2023)]